MLMGHLRCLEIKTGLVLLLAEYLYQLFEPTGDVVGIRELGVLPAHLLGLHERQIWVASHCVVIGVTVLVSANQKVYIVAPSPPHRGSLAVENHWREEV